MYNKQHFKDVAETMQQRKVLHSGSFHYSASQTQNSKLMFLLQLVI
jgi:hypothetical protein